MGPSFIDINDVQGFIYFMLLYSKNNGDWGLVNLKLWERGMKMSSL